ncbi:salivary glue protein Sgs-3-like [Anthonomus grandis grandis]|uniref:salivary glue protein Sgs-3-like n=1 Tax=Anthonomus grandis grandis TaxID=2921223 RepID=UPI002165A6FB|nr:salivary glue protein Sgs-3-like [Anthonomus grandis grandis]
MQVTLLYLVLAMGSALVSASPEPNCINSKDVYFPDSNCNSFWQCSNGIAHKMICPSNLEWNAALNVCDWPSSAGCSGEGWHTTTVQPTRPSTRTTTKANTTTTKTTTTATSTTSKPTTTSRKPSPTSSTTFTAKSSSISTTNAATTRRPWTRPTLPTRSTTTKASTTITTTKKPQRPTRSTTTRRPWRPSPPRPNKCSIWWWLPECRRWAESA